MVYIVIGIVIAVLIALWLFMVAPKTSRRSRMAPYEERYIAHRGLYDNDGPAPENSLAAFRKAVENGYGIELDVQLTSDGKLVVFHDGSLLRMTGVDKMLYECSFEELSGYSLADSAEHIPLFSDVLEVIGGKVPLIVEVKSEGDCIATTKAAAEMLDDYSGEYCMESFNVLSVRWVRKHRPNVIRGQLSLDYFIWHPEMPWLHKLALSDLALNFLSRPDFIAYDHTEAYRLSYRLIRRIFRPANVAWTVKSPEQLEKAKRIFGTIIFDSFIPEGELGRQPGKKN